MQVALSPATISWNEENIRGEYIRLPPVRIHGAIELNAAIMTTNRCAWASVDDPLLLEYHDREWGVPVHRDRKHFEVLVLSGAQAGLNLP
jgi:hypothetical protein